MTWNMLLCGLFVKWLFWISKMIKTGVHAFKKPIFQTNSFQQQWRRKSKQSCHRAGKNTYCMKISPQYLYPNKSYKPQTKGSIRKSNSEKTCFKVYTTWTRQFQDVFITLYQDTSLEQLYSVGPHQSYCENVKNPHKSRGCARISVTRGLTSLTGGYITELMVSF